MGRDRPHSRRLSVAVLMTAGVGIVASSRPSSANHMTVTEVEGSAYGRYGKVNWPSRESGQV